MSYPLQKAENCRALPRTKQSKKIFTYNHLNLFLYFYGIVEMADSRIKNCIIGFCSGLILCMLNIDNALNLNDN